MEETPGQKQSNGMMVGIVTLIALIVLGGVGYKLYTHVMRLQAQSTQNSMTITPSPTQEAMATPTQAASNSAMTNEEMAVTVTGSSYAFSPSVIHAKLGEKIKLTFKNTQALHDFSLDQFNVHTAPISAGKSEDVEFIASKKGSFQYYCSVGNHRQMGMVGTLIVE